MVCGLFACPKAWQICLPPGLQGLTRRENISGRRWDLLVLTSASLLQLDGMCPSCGIVLLPGGSAAEFASGIQSVITYGLSYQDSLTLSSLEKPVLCVQRRLPRPDGGVVEPQEFPLGDLPVPADEWLPLLGAYLLLT